MISCEGSAFPLHVLRPSPDGTTNRYDVIVTVDDGNGIEEEANCGGSCSFWVRTYAQTVFILIVHAKFIFAVQMNSK